MAQPPCNRTEAHKYVGCHVRRTFFEGTFTGTVESVDLAEDGPVDERTIFHIRYDDGVTEEYWYKDLLRYQVPKEEEEGSGGNAAPPPGSGGASAWHAAGPGAHRPTKQLRLPGVTRSRAPAPKVVEGADGIKATCLGSGGPGAERAALASAVKRLLLPGATRSRPAPPPPPPAPSTSSGGSSDSEASKDDGDSARGARSVALLAPGAAKGGARTRPRISLPTGSDDAVLRAPAGAEGGVRSRLRRRSVPVGGHAAEREESAAAEATESEPEASDEEMDDAAAEGGEGGVAAAVPEGQRKRLKDVNREPHGEQEGAEEQEKDEQDDTGGRGVKRSKGGDRGKGRAGGDGDGFDLEGWVEDVQQKRLFERNLPGVLLLVPDPNFTSTIMDRTGSFKSGVTDVCTAMLVGDICSIDTDWAPELAKYSTDAVAAVTAARYKQQLDKAVLRPGSKEVPASIKVRKEIIPTVSALAKLHGSAVQATDHLVKLAIDELREQYPERTSAPADVRFVLDTYDLTLEVVENPTLLPKMTLKEPPYTLNTHEERKHARKAATEFLASRSSEVSSWQKEATTEKQKVRRKANTRQP